MFKNNLFTGNLDGISATSKFRQVFSVDRSKNKLKDRLLEVNNVLETDSFFEDYFSDVYDPHVNSESALSEENNVCKMLSGMADYLMKSDESKEISKREETIYVFSDEDLQDKINKESTGDFNFDNVEIVTRPRSRNEYLLPQQTVSKSDLSEKTYLGAVLRDYDSFLNSIEEKMRSINRGYRMLSTQKFLVKQDMIDAKNMLRGVWGENCNPKYPQLEKEYNIFDFSDRRTVSYLLTMNYNFDANKSLWVTALDFRNFVKTVDLNDVELALSDLFLKGYTSVQVEDEFGLKSDYVRKIKERIVTKIIKKNNKYDFNDAVGKKMIKLIKFKNKQDEYLEEIA